MVRDQGRAEPLRRLRNPDRGGDGRHSRQQLHLGAVRGQQGMHMDRNRQRRVPLRPRNRTREPFPAKGRRRQPYHGKYPPNRARTGQHGLDSRRKSGILPVRLRRKNPDTHPRRQNGTEDLFGPKHLFHGPERHLHNPRRRQYLFVGGQSGKRHAALSRRREERKRSATDTPIVSCPERSTKCTPAHLWGCSK